MIFQGFWIRFCNSICRMPTPPGTKRKKGKRQEHADNCRNMQKSNATNYANIKTPIEDLQAAECNQLQQTPTFKIGGGGARAARRIRIQPCHTLFIVEEGDDMALKVSEPTPRGKWQILDRLASPLQETFPAKVFIPNEIRARHIFVEGPRASHGCRLTSRD